MVTLRIVISNTYSLKKFGPSSFLLSNRCIQTSVILLTLCIAHPPIAHETSANSKEAVVQR